MLQSQDSINNFFLKMMELGKRGAEKFGKKLDKLLRNKIGAEMSISTIVVVAIAVIVLIVVVFGFTTGWQNLLDKINVFAANPNAGTVAQACMNACGSGSVYDYCVLGRKVYFGDDRDKAKKTYSCKELERERIGLEACTGFDCSKVGMTCAQLGGEWTSGNCPSGADNRKSDDITSSVTSSEDKALYPGQKCCTRACTEMTRNGVSGRYCDNGNCNSALVVSVPSGKFFADDNKRDGSVECCIISKCP